MRKLNLFGLLLAGMSASALVGCSEDISIADQMNEDYVKSFIEKYGLPGEGNMFNMAKRGQVTVKSSQPVNVEVIAMENGKYYSFAYCQGLVGSQTLNFDIPSYMQDIVLYVDGQYYPTKIGATYDLDHPTRSRDGEEMVWSDAKLGNFTGDHIKIMDNFNEVKDDGRVVPNLESLSETVVEQGAEITCSETSFYHTGIELKKYVSEDSKVYEQYDNYGNGAWWGNGNGCKVSILNVNKPDPSHEYELGVYFGDKPSLLSSDNVIFMPFYRTGEVKNDDSVMRDYYGRDENFSYENAGFELVIDFAQNRFEIVEFDGFRYFNQTIWYGEGFLGDNKVNYPANSLEARLERHALAQQDKFPFISDLRENGADDCDTKLPKLSEVDNLWDFYDKYDAYIWEWLGKNPDVKKDIDEYDYFRELMGTNFRVIPEHAIPVVTKEGDRKYRIIYITAYPPKYIGKPAYYTRANGKSFCNIQDDHLYSWDRITFTVPGAGTDAEHEYAIYMKDLNDGTVVSTADGSRVKNSGAYIRTENENHKAFNGFYIDMMDFDGDGLYNDFVFERAWPGTGHEGPEFEEYPWLLVCEDLGSTGDCDFNDAVFAIQYVYGNKLTVQNINIRPLAAGGIYPTYLMWSDGNTDYMVGKEIHSWLGDASVNEKGELTFINTEEDNYSERGAMPATFEWDMAQHNFAGFSLDAFANSHWGGNGTMAGFWLLVDKDNSIAELANQDITFSICDTQAMMAKYPTLWKVNNHPIGGNSIIPQMMLVTHEWEWPKERHNIENVYDLWSGWMSSTNSAEFKWYGEGVDGDKINRDLVVKRR